VPGSGVPGAAEAGGAQEDPPGSAWGIAAALLPLLLPLLSALPSGVGGAAPLAAQLARQKAVDWRCVNPGPRCAVDPGLGVVNLTVNHKTPGMMDSGKTLFLYGTFGIHIRHPPGYTGGTIMAFYLQDMLSTSNKDVRRAEIDVEIYGAQNSSRLVYTTNIFSGEQRRHLRCRW